jgi:hypothetical protein
VGQAQNTPRMVARCSMPSSAAAPRLLVVIAISACAVAIRPSPTTHAATGTVPGVSATRGPGGWAALSAELLPVPYFHVVFTLPTSYPPMCCRTRDCTTCSSAPVPQRCSKLLAIRSTKGADIVASFWFDAPSGCLTRRSFALTAPDPIMNHSAPIYVRAHGLQRRQREPMLIRAHQALDSTTSCHLRTW